MMKVGWRPERRWRFLRIIVVREGLLFVVGNQGVRDVIVPADAHNAAKRFFVEGFETLLLNFGK